MQRRVNVFLYGENVGELQQNDDGFLFTYRQGYSGPALSVSLPVANGSFHHGTLHPYFASLAPEGWLNKRYSQLQHRDEADLLGMLIDNGENLIGAVRFSNKED